MERKWTFMVYMAGDNGKVFDDGMQLMDDLTAFGWQDLHEMAQVGSTADVAIVAQYDTLTESEFTYRFAIEKSGVDKETAQKIPPVNTGDPKNLTEFIVWAVSEELTTVVCLENSVSVRNADESITGEVILVSKQMTEVGIGVPPLPLG